MSQNYKVFTENKVIFIDSFKHSDAIILPTPKGAKNTKQLFKELNNTVSSQFVLNLNENGIDFEKFKSFFPQIKAAGGIVFQNDQLLMIYRNGKWDLPKGWVESDEYTAQAALREVREECGNIQLEITDLQPVLTHHLYKLKNKIVWKETSWFKMKAIGESQLKPQRKEGISKVEFVSFEQVDERLSSSYPLLQSLWAEINM